MNFEAEKKELKKRIDEDVRQLYTDERKLNKFQINEKLLFITNNLWDSFQSVISPMRKKIQELESEILVSRYNLDETLRKHCKSKEDFKRAEKELHEVEENIDKHRKEMQSIEEKYNKGNAEGDLKRLPFWVFIVLMSIVGIAEITIYFYVFQSQEIKDLTTIIDPIDRAMYYGFPLIMATGFTVMMIWLAHKLGMMLRQYASIHKNLQQAYWIKFIVIAVVVTAAIWATVEIRGKMHEIMYIQNKIVEMQENGGIDLSMGGNPAKSNNSDDVMEDDMSMDMSDEMSIDGKEESLDDKKETLKKELAAQAMTESNGTLPKTQEGLEYLVTQLKGELAKLFILINLFVVIAGVFLAYEVHTSSVHYEALESMIDRLEKRRKELQKVKSEAEKALSKNEKDELMQVLNQYVKAVNTFDEYSQTVKTLKVAIQNVYIEMVYYMLGAMEEHNLLSEFDLEYMEQFSPEYLVNRFRQEWKLENIDVEADEVMHIHNIEDFIKEFQCDSLRKKGSENV